MLSLDLITSAVSQVSDKGNSFIAEWQDQPQMKMDFFLSTLLSVPFSGSSNS